MLVRGIVIVAALTVAVSNPTIAPGCNAMSGSASCDIGFLPGVGEGGSRDGGARRGGALPPMSTLGGDLSGTFDRPGTIGAISFGSGGRKCSGMFRSVDC